MPYARWCVVNFPIVGEEGVFFVAWTTTPWTLPSNMALCVNPDMEYCRVTDAAKASQLQGRETHDRVCEESEVNSVK